MTSAPIPRCSLLPRSITTLYVGGLAPQIAEDDVRDAFYAFGALASVRKVRPAALPIQCPANGRCGAC